MTASLLAVQRAFSARIRNPDAEPAPSDVPPVRMQLYERLVYNNVARLVTGAFPIAQARLGEAAWSRLVRRFLIEHGSDSPYFSAISEAFIQFLMGADGPPWLAELCHHERLPSVLRRLETPALPAGCSCEGKLLQQRPVLSPQCVLPSYRYPVHRITAESPEPEPKPTWLIALLRDEQVRCIDTNPRTHRLLELLDGQRTGADALAELVAELPHISAERLQSQGEAMLERLRQVGVICVPAEDAGSPGLG